MTQFNFHIQLGKSLVISVKGWQRTTAGWRLVVSCDLPWRKRGRRKLLGQVWGRANPQADGSRLGITSQTMRRTAGKKPRGSVALVVTRLSGKSFRSIPYLGMQIMITLDLCSQSTDILHIRFWDDINESWKLDLILKLWWLKILLSEKSCYVVKGKFTSKENFHDKRRELPKAGDYN